MPEFGKRESWIRRPYPHAVGIAALCYIAWDYTRVLSPALHATLRPVLWGVLAVAVILRVPFYPHWAKELRSLIPFVGSLLFMLGAFCVEAMAVQFVTVVLGIDWHWYVHSPAVSRGCLRNSVRSCLRHRESTLRTLCLACFLEYAGQLPLFPTQDSGYSLP